MFGWMASKVNGRGRGGRPGAPAGRRERARARLGHRGEVGGDEFLAILRNDARCARPAKLRAALREPYEVAKETTAKWAQA